MICFYHQNKNGICIDRCLGSDGILELPEEIDGQPVTELASYIFSEGLDEDDRRSYLKNDRICSEEGTADPDKYPDIAGNRLTELYLPSRLRKIGRYAFYNCFQLKKISFQGNLKDLGAGALTGCHRMEYIHVKTDEKGESHTIQDVDKEDVEEDTLALVKYGSFLALQYDSKEQNASKRLVEEGDELLFAEAKTMYVLDDVYVRAQPEFAAEPVLVAGRGSEIQVTGEFPKWYQMKLEDGEGFISKSYVTAKKEEAEQAAAADAQARAAKAAEQQAAEQAQEEAAWTDQAGVGDASASWSGGDTAEAAPQERMEVSRQAYDDCDGSGHGYFEITYSDGTVEIQEY